MHIVVTPKGKQTVKGVSSSYDALIDFLETIERIMARLNLYTAEIVRPGFVDDEIIVEIIAELLSTLAVVTKKIKENRSVGNPILTDTLLSTEHNALISGKTLLGENQIEAVLQRLDRLTPDETRKTTVQTQLLDVVYSLIQNMRVVMDGEQTQQNFQTLPADRPSI